jgi:Arc/MetJ family transcription regulator
MRTNIVIDDELLDAAMRAGPFKTKKDAVEAGLKLLARQAAYRDILALRGKLRWDDAPAAGAAVVNEPQTGYRTTKASTGTRGRQK